jgi:type IV pilus assembly protein PilA
MAGAAKLAVAETYDSTGSFPDDNDAAGLPSAASITGTYVDEIEVISNLVTILYNGSVGGNPDADGTEMYLTATPSQGSMMWVCTGNMVSKYKPANCR